MLASAQLNLHAFPASSSSKSADSSPGHELVSSDLVVGPSSGSATPAQLPGSAAPSFRSRSHSTSSQQTPIVHLPDGFRPSILLNSKRRSLRAVASEANSTEALVYRLPPAPVVTRIPAVSSWKQREKDKEREREREREKEMLRSKNKSEERIWGIPKKTLLLGLGDLNFNAQMAMLGGWGYGSGSASYTNTPVGSLGSTTSHMMISSSRKADNDSSDSNSVHEEEHMDPEELAALNAIINTRRSMAAAQALVNGCINFHARSARAASVGSSMSTSTRPALSEIRAESLKSVPSMNSIGYSGSSTGSNSGPIVPSGKDEIILNGAPVLQRLSSEGIGGVETVGLSASLMGTSPSKHARIRFAPLPQSFGTPPHNGVALVQGPSADGSHNGSTSNGTVTHQGPIDAEHNRLRRQDSNNSQLDDSVSDFGSDDDDEKSGKGKWYLMGMPSAYFKPHYYQSKSSRRRSGHIKHGSISGASSINQDQESGDPTVNRRKSTGSVSKLMGSESVRKRCCLDNGASDKEEEERGRSGGRPHSAGRPSSSSRKSNRSTSRSGARGSGDEDERARRRELIRMARPGGTGMVTLPDGTKIRARRVNDDPGLEPEIQEWGFAGLAKEASRRSAGSEVSLPSTAGFATEYFTDEVDDDMAWVHRRKREREEKARAEKEAAELAATETVAAPSVEALDIPEKTTPAAAIAAEERSRDAAIAAAALISNVSSEVDNGPAAVQEEVAPALQLVLETAPASMTAPKMDENVAAETAPALSVARNRRSANITKEAPSMTGSGIQMRVDSRPGGEKTVPSKGLALSADQAEEIRRRHEDEVCALGAEVLAQNRRNIQRRVTSGAGAAGPTSKSVTRQASVQAATTQSSPSRAARSNSTINSGSTSLAGSRLISRTSSREASADGRRTDELQPLTPIPRKATSKKATADSERTILITSPLSDAGEEAVVSPTMILEQPMTIMSPTASSINLPAEAKTKRDSSPSGSRLSHQSSIIIRNELPYISQPANVSQSSSLNATGSSASTFSQSPKNRHISLDPSISVPTPSPWLPLRPDARGKAVVPLPQLGIRPERPREGRVWQYDVSDDSASESDVHNDDDDDDDLNAEELEEEERKTAMQKKRATTRAAGQEVVHSRGDAERRVSITPGKKKSPSRQVAPKFVRPTPSSNSVKSASTRGYSDVDLESDAQSEKDLWPAVSAASRHNGTPKPRHILVNLPGGPGIWDTKKGGGASSVPAINSVAAARAKAVKQRAKKQKEFQLAPDWDDEMMDYGWPRSLKGSLY